jgi:uracil-DNA glycosylase family 4
VAEIPESCALCRRCDRALSPFMPASGATKRCDVLFVGDVPGKYEDINGVHFLGDAGKVLKAALDECGYTKVRKGYVNAVRCAPGTPTPEEVRLCRPFVLADIEQIQPKLVVLLGAVALKGVLNQMNITRRRGHPQRVNEQLYLPTFNPLAIARDPRKMKDFVADLAYARQLIAELGDEPKYKKLKARYTIPQTKADVLACIAEMRASKVIALDTEFYPLDWLRDDLTLLAVSMTNGPKKGYAFAVDHPECPWRFDEDVKNALRDLITNVPIIPHNGEVDTVVLARTLGVPLRAIVVRFDTMISSMALRGEDASHSLKTLAHLDGVDTGGYEEEVDAWLLAHGMHKKKRTKKEQEEEKETESSPSVEVDFGKIPLDILLNPYAAADADTVAQITRVHHPRIKQTGQEVFYYQVALPSYYLNVVMRSHGLLIDEEQWAWRRDALQKAREEVYANVLADPAVSEFAKGMAGQGKEFSFKSHPQMRALLFDVLGLTPSGRRTKQSGEDSLDAKALREMKAIEGNTHPILDWMLTASKINTYEGTFINGWKEAQWTDGRVHPRFHNFTSSFRRGTSYPNSQNVPPGSKQPDDLWNMRMLIGSPPRKSLCQWDYGGLEYRTAACYSEDPNMLAGCAPGVNPHIRAQESLDLPYKVVKIANYLFLYGGNAPKLQGEILDKTGEHWPLADVEKVLNEMNSYYSVLLGYIARTHRLAVAQKFISTPIGQVRWLPHIESTDKAVRERAKREAWSHLNQSIGHAFLQVAMDKMQRYIEETGKDWEIINDTHDGFLAYVPTDEIAEAGQAGVHFMQEAPKELVGDWLKVDLPVEFSYGTHWGNMTVLEV